MPGRNTRRKILVIESDDWGSIRIPSKQVYNTFVNRGYGVENSAYNKYDSLESEDDLTALFETLQKFKDIHNNSAVFTGNCIIANPDFEKIKSNAYQNYYYELVTETIKKYPAHANVFKIWQQGAGEKVFVPQCHGREHLHVGRWMKRLQEGDKELLFCFDQQTTFSGNGVTDYSFMESFDFDDKNELNNLNNILEEGLQLFKQLIGSASKSFIAPCYTWHPDMEMHMNKNGVKYIQGNIVQLIPPLRNNRYKKKYHFMGQGGNGVMYLVRNCIFEPALHPELDAVTRCLAQIDIAFKWNKPAIVSSHRLNYIGCIDENNRKKHLSMLEQLLSAIQKKWPDVEFMSTNEVGDLLSGERNN